MKTLRPFLTLLPMALLLLASAAAVAAESPFLYGIHDADPNPSEYLNHIVSGAGPGWVTATVAIGANTNDQTGVDFTSLANQGHTVICRINHGYFPNGTIPLPARYDDFAKRCANFVTHSPGCSLWVIGNELNIAGEWPADPVTLRCAYVAPSDYASCFRRVYNAIKAVHPTDKIISQAPAPFSGPFGQQTLPYAGTNYIADPNRLNWVQHLKAVLTNINNSGPLDGIALHVYSRGYHCSDIHSTQKVAANGQSLFFSFNCYQDWVNLGIPGSLYNLPLYITECDGYYFWKGGHPENASAHYEPGWVQEAYAEINRYNQAALATFKPVFRCVNLYRWCAWCDGWNIDGDNPYKPQILSDLDQAVAQRYQWPTNNAMLLTPIGLNFMDPGADDDSVPICEEAGAVPLRGWVNLTQGGTGNNIDIGSGITVTWSTPGGGTHPFGSMPTSPADFALMAGYLDTGDTSTDTVTVSGIKFPFYDVIVYSDGDNGGATRVGKYTLTASGTTITKYVRDDAVVNFTGSYTEADSTTGGPSAPAGNYCRFRNVHGGSFTLTSKGDYASDGHPRGPLNALQIIPLGLPPSITSQPRSLTLNQGADATFSVVATGTTRLGYQWRFNGTNIPGATESAYTRTAAQATDAGSYSVVVTNIAGSATSSDAILTVNVPPSISVPPHDLIVNQGSNALFTVVAAGTLPLSYRWRFNSAPIPGATDSAYTRSAAQPADAGFYSVVVTNIAGNITSADAILTVNVPPTISVPPHDLIVNQGSNALFTVVAAGTLPLSYQWRFNGASISSATGSNYARPGAQPADAGSYSVAVTNIAGGVTSSSAVLRVNLPPVADASATKTPLISPNGTNATVVLNASRSFDPDGDPLHYLWFTTNSPTLRATGVVAVVHLQVGAHPINLVADDGMATSTNHITVEILTPCQAIPRLITLVAQSGLPHPQALLATLQAAQASACRGDPIPAASQLQAFQNKVRAQVSPLDPALASTFFQSAQQIIDPLNGNLLGNRTGKTLLRVRRSAEKNHISFTGTARQTYIFEASADLTDWEMIGVASEPEEGSFDFVDTSAPNFPNRFYRAVLP